MQPIVIAVMMFAALYVFSVRPQIKRQRELRDMLARLATDDVVVTRGGMIGKIAALTGDVVVLEVQDQVRIQVPRAYVEGKWVAAAA